MKFETLEKGKSLQIHIYRLSRLLNFSAELKFQSSNWDSFQLKDTVSEETVNKVEALRQDICNLVYADLQDQLAALEKEFEELSDETMTEEA